MGGENMDKVKFHKEEAISFLETKIELNEANQDELELYEDYQWSGKLDKTNYTYKLLIKQMRRLHEVKY
jgi:hypothetical protein